MMRTATVFLFLSLSLTCSPQSADSDDISVDSLSTGRILGEMMVRELITGDLIEHVATGNSAGMEYELLDMAQQALYLILMDAGSKQRKGNAEAYKKGTNNGSDAGVSGVVTTTEEMEAYDIVRSILEPAGFASRISPEDNLSYCAILLDYSGKRTICRLYFNNPMERYAIIHDRKGGSRVDLTDPQALYRYADRIIAAARAMDKGKGRKLR